MGISGGLSARREGRFRFAGRRRCRPNRSEHNQLNKKTTTRFNSIIRTNSPSQAGKTMDNSTPPGSTQENIMDKQAVTGRHDSGPVLQLCAPRKRSFSVDRPRSDLCASAPLREIPLLSATQAIPSAPSGHLRRPHSPCIEPCHLDQRPDWPLEIVRMRRSTVEHHARGVRMRYSTVDRRISDTRNVVLNR